ncbi:MAG: hypothetical protein V2A79_11890 [Planctomycetota bacterium]
MSGPEAVAAVVREWVEKADNDLKSAAHLLTLRDWSGEQRLDFYRRAHEALVRRQKQLRERSGGTVQRDPGGEVRLPARRDGSATGEDLYAYNLPLVRISLPLLQR